MNGQLDPNVGLTTEWRPDLLDGVMVIKGKFTDGSTMTAIPNYARNNRQGANQGPAGADALIGEGQRGTGSGVMSLPSSAWAMPTTKGINISSFFMCHLIGFPE